MAEPTLVNASIEFHTRDDDKDGDTFVVVSVRDFHNVVVARMSNHLGHFDDHSNRGPFPLRIRQAAPKSALQRGSVRLRIDPNGNDTWRFHFDLVLRFSDGSALGYESDPTELTEERDQEIFGLEGFLEPVEV